ncbi:uncharacterized protein [Fopius arisanus]|uniref:DUF7041 domain-containing protein n=1 Tax=Fopius arisanus TaxID=64838 RepID=A0A9R1TMT4_9HYME|nr:PREDICTED: uncharacterized protein LOC105272153 [Fopius arisanus]
MTIEHSPTRSGNNDADLGSQETRLQQQQLVIDELQQRLQHLQTEGTSLIPGTHSQPGILPFQTQGDTVPTQTLAAINQIKLPGFWKTNPDLWFIHAEAHFYTKKITVDSTKYFHVVSALDADCLRQVSDIIRHPPEADKYKNIKDELIERFSDSKEKQLHKLLTGLELGTRKPSELLREMKNLSAGCVTDEMIRTLWLNHLPITLRSILSATDDLDVDKMATLADKVNDVTSGHTVMATHTRNTTSSSTVEEQVRKLNERFETLVQGFSELTARINRLSPTHHRSRSRSKSTNVNSANNSNRSGVCFYHWKFGEKAKRCIEPCSASSTTGQAEN